MRRDAPDLRYPTGTNSVVWILPKSSDESTILIVGSSSSIRFAYSWRKQVSRESKWPVGKMPEQQKHPQNDVFRTCLLKPVYSEPLPGQIIHKPQLPAIQVDNEDEYEVDVILDQKTARGGKQQFLVKWTGYDRPTWTQASAMEDTAALDQWEASLRAGKVPLGGRKGRQNKRKGDRSLRGEKQ